MASSPESVRKVRLIDARSPDRAVFAQVLREFPASKLDLIEADWADARQQAADAEEAFGMAPIEHAHWDWRNKRESIKTGRHMAVVVECDGDIQGAMAVLRTPVPSRLKPGHVLYVDYLEAAPWNLRAFSGQPRYFGVGTVLISEAILSSIDMQLQSAIALHSLPQAERF